MSGSERFSETEPGYQYYRDKKETSASGTIVATFEGEDLTGKPVNTTAFFACTEGDTVVSATSPYTFKNPVKKQRPKEISRKTVAIQRMKEAWNTPFITVVEPARPGNETVTEVQRIALNPSAVAIEVKGPRHATANHPRHASLAGLALDQREVLLADHAVLAGLHPLDDSLPLRLVDSRLAVEVQEGAEQV